MDGVGSTACPTNCNSCWKSEMVTRSRHPGGGVVMLPSKISGRGRIRSPYFRAGHPGQKPAPHPLVLPFRFFSASSCRAICCCWSKWIDLMAAGVDDKPYVRASAAAVANWTIIRAMVTEDRFPYRIKSWWTAEVYFEVSGRTHSRRGKSWSLAVASGLDLGDLDEMDEAPSSNRSIRLSSLAAHSYWTAH